jgi:D-serine deaminase-like pyridoxal phosphate-dependent protein
MREMKVTGNRPRWPNGSREPWFDTPSLLIDMDVLAANIARMSALAQRSKVSLRPHVKTHKSVRIARMQLEAGAIGVCVAKTGEAEVMRAGGITEIMIAYPIVGEAKLARLVPLVADGGITLVTDSVEVAEGYSQLSSKAARTLPVLLEIDSGMHRAGVSPAHAGLVAAKIAALPGLDLHGILTHAGHAHDVTTQPEVEAVARAEARAMQQARESLEAAKITVQVVSAGSTITAPYLSADDGITEIRPGTYVFNDLRTLELFACTPDQIAATILATVVSVGPERAVLDAGSKTLTMTSTQQHGYGRLRNRPRSTFTRLSEEHGVLHLDPEEPELRVGEQVEVLPIHICACVDLQQHAYGFSHGRFAEILPVDAGRRSR